MEEIFMEVEHDTTNVQGATNIMTTSSSGTTLSILAGTSDTSPSSNIAPEQTSSQNSTQLLFPTPKANEKNNTKNKAKLKNQQRHAEQRDNRLKTNQPNTVTDVIRISQFSTAFVFAVQAVLNKSIDFNLFKNIYNDHIVPCQRLSINGIPTEKLPQAREITDMSIATMGVMTDLLPSNNRTMGTMNLHDAVVDAVYQASSIQDSNPVTLEVTIQAITNLAIAIHDATNSALRASTINPSDDNTNIQSTSSTPEPVNPAYAIHVPDPNSVEVDVIQKLNSMFERYLHLWYLKHEDKIAMLTYDQTTQSIADRVKIASVPVRSSSRGSERTDKANAFFDNVTSKLSGSAYFTKLLQKYTDPDVISFINNGILATNSILSTITKFNETNANNQPGLYLLHRALRFPLVYYIEGQGSNSQDIRYIIKDSVTILEKPPRGNKKPIKLNVQKNMNLSDLRLSSIKDTQNSPIESGSSPKRRRTNGKSATNIPVTDESTKNIPVPKPDDPKDKDTTANTYWGNLRSYYTTLDNLLRSEIIFTNQDNVVFVKPMQYYNENKEILQSIVTIGNTMLSVGFRFASCYILYCVYYTESTNVLEHTPDIDKPDFFRSILYTVTSLNIKTKIPDTPMKGFFDGIFSRYLSGNKTLDPGSFAATSVDGIPRDYLSDLVNELSVMMHTSYRNTIIANGPRILEKVIKVLYTKRRKEDIQNTIATKQQEAEAAAAAVVGGGTNRAELDKNLARINKLQTQLEKKIPKDIQHIVTIILNISPLETDAAKHTFTDEEMFFMNNNLIAKEFITKYLGILTPGRTRLEKDRGTTIKQDITTFPFDYFPSFMYMLHEIEYQQDKDIHNYQNEKKTKVIEQQNELMNALQANFETTLSSSESSPNGIAKDIIQKMQSFLAADTELANAENLKTSQKNLSLFPMHRTGIPGYVPLVTVTIFKVLKMNDEDVNAFPDLQIFKSNVSHYQEFVWNYFFNVQKIKKYQAWRSKSELNPQPKISALVIPGNAPIAEFIANEGQSSTLSARPEVENPDMNEETMMLESTTLIGSNIGIVSPPELSVPPPAPPPRVPKRVPTPAPTIAPTSAPEQVSKPPKCTFPQNQRNQRLHFKYRALTDGINVFLTYGVLYKRSKQELKARKDRKIATEDDDEEVQTPDEIVQQVIDEEQDAAAIEGQTTEAVADNDFSIDIDADTKKLKDIFALLQPELDTVSIFGKTEDEVYTEISDLIKRYVERYTKDHTPSTGKALVGKVLTTDDINVFNDKENPLYPFSIDAGGNNVIVGMSGPPPQDPDHIIRITFNPCARKVDDNETITITFTQSIDNKIITIQETIMKRHSESYHRYFNEYIEKELTTEGKYENTKSVTVRVVVHSLHHNRLNNTVYYTTEKKKNVNRKKFSNLSALEAYINDQRKQLHPNTPSMSTLHKKDMRQPAVLESSTTHTNIYTSNLSNPNLPTESPAATWKIVLNVSHTVNGVTRVKTKSMIKGYKATDSSDLCNIYPFPLPDSVHMDTTEGTATTTGSSSSKSNPPISNTSSSNAAPLQMKHPVTFLKLVETILPEAHHTELRRKGTKNKVIWDRLATKLDIDTKFISAVPGPKKYMEGKNLPYKNGTNELDTTLFTLSKRKVWNDQKSAVLARVLREDKQNTFIESTPDDIFHGKSIQEIEDFIGSYEFKSFQYHNVCLYTYVQNAMEKYLLRFYQNKKYRVLKGEAYVARRALEQKFLYTVRTHLGAPNEMYISVGHFANSRRLNPNNRFLQLLEDYGYYVSIVQEEYTSKICSNCKDKWVVGTFAEADLHRVLDDDDNLEVDNEDNGGNDNWNQFWTGCTIAQSPNKGENKNLRVTITASDGTTTEKEIHGLLQCQKCGEIWDRDINGVINIGLITLAAYFGLTRPEHLPFKIDIDLRRKCLRYLKRNFQYEQ